jgi:hypothetical protein
MNPLPVPIDFENVSEAIDALNLETESSQKMRVSSSFPLSIPNRMIGGLNKPLDLHGFSTNERHSFTPSHNNKLYVSDADDEFDDNESLLDDTPSMLLLTPFTNQVGGVLLY